VRQIDGLPRQFAVGGKRPWVPEGDIAGYAVKATDGPCGHIDDLLLDDTTWRVEFLLVNPRNLLPGTPRTVPAAWVEACDWLSHCVRMRVDKDRIHDCPKDETSSTIDHLIKSV